MMLNLSSTDKIQSVVAQVKALREINRTTGTVTRRAQSLILRELNEAELTAAALLLAEHGEACDE